MGQIPNFFKRTVNPHSKDLKREVTVDSLGVSTLNAQNVWDEDGWSESSDRSLHP